MAAPPGAPYRSQCMDTTRNRAAAAERFPWRAAHPGQRDFAKRSVDVAPATLSLPALLSSFSALTLHAGAKVVAT
jgi:hypothetical protein